MSETGLVPSSGTQVVVWDDWTRNQEYVDVVKNHLFKGDGTPGDFDLFCAQCRRTRLDPIARQIYPVFRNEKNSHVKKMQIQTSIDGFRLIATRTGEFQGRATTYWCDSDGVWVDVWLKDYPPYAAKVGVWRKGFREASYCVAIYKEYVQTSQYGPMGMWGKMPANQIAKCAEALSLRSAFPNDLSGLYTDDEMGQADNTMPQSLSATLTPEPYTQPHEMKAYEVPAYLQKDTPSTEAPPTPNQPAPPANNALKAGKSAFVAAMRANDLDPKDGEAVAYWLGKCSGLDMTTKPAFTGNMYLQAAGKLGGLVEDDRAAQMQARKAPADVVDAVLVEDDGVASGPGEGDEDDDLVDPFAE